MILLFLSVFLLSGGYILYSKKKQKETIQSQFIITGTLLLIFYIVCFISGICSILNFIWKYIL